MCRARVFWVPHADYLAGSCARSGSGSLLWLFVIDSELLSVLGKIPVCDCIVLPVGLVTVFVLGGVCDAPTGATRRWHWSVFRKSLGPGARLVVEFSF